MPRRVVGLWVVNRQPHEPEVIPWQEWLRLVALAEKEERRDVSRRYKGALLPPSALPRCQFVNKRGAQCKHFPLRGGATRCRDHGGPRQVPHHPAAVHMLRMGELDRVSLDKCGPKRKPSRITAADARKQVAAALEARGLYRAGPHARAGRHALRYGTAQDWQAWLAETARMAAQEAR